MALCRHKQIMMKKLLILWLFAITTSFEKPSMRDVAAGQPEAANTYEFWGDSIMAGNELNQTSYGGPNNIGLVWTLQYPVLHSGIRSGAPQSGAVLVNNWGGNGPFEDRLNEVSVYDPSVHAAFFIGYGFNDYYHAMAPPNSLSTQQFLDVFIPKLKSTIDYIHNVKGWPLNKIRMVWNFLGRDLPGYYITKAGWVTARNAVKAASSQKSVGFIDFQAYFESRSDNEDYSYRVYNNSRDYIHPMEPANALMAQNADALTVFSTATPPPPPPPPVNAIRVKGRKSIVQ